MKAWRGSLGLLGVVTVGSSAWAQPCEPAWSDRFATSELNGFVFDLSVFDDGSEAALYVGGGFTFAGDVQVNRVARLEGNTWKPLGSGMDGSVFALAGCSKCPGSGPGLYAGGAFQTAGGAAASAIARWDGSTWSPLGAGVGGQPIGTVNALLVAGDGSDQGPVLYAGGWFETAGGLPARSVARWDGSVWSSLGNGLEGSVRALALFDDGSGPALYAGGSFTMSGDIEVNHIARWDGHAWSPVGAGLDDSVRALAVFDDGSGPALYAAGDFVASGGTPLERIARWQGKAWSSVPGGGLNGQVDALVVLGEESGTTLVAGGHFTVAGGIPAERIAKWDGTGWSPFGIGCDSAVVALESLADGTGKGQSLYAGGFFDWVGGVSAPRVARWNGNGWARIDNGIDGQVYDMAVLDDGTGSGSSLYVAGAFGSAGGVPAHGIARWNGSGWLDMEGGVDGYVGALAVFDDGAGPDLYLGGYFQSAGGFHAYSIARWDGSDWSPPMASGVNNKIYALEVFDDGSGPRLYVGGDFTSAGGQPACDIASWDGQGWSMPEMGDCPEGISYVSTLEVLDDGSGPALYVGGRFDSIGGIPAAGIARWNGSAWSAVGDGIEGYVSALAVFDDGSGPALYAGGYICVPGDGPCAIARWDGSEWVGLGSGVASTYYPVPVVHDLAVHDDGSGQGPALYAGGLFSTAGGVAANGIARWDGSQWSPLGSGMVGSTLFEPVVYALAVFEDAAGQAPALFAGGDFKSAGPFSSTGIARWGCAVSAFGDLTGDGTVDQSDLVTLLKSWGPCPGGCAPGCTADLDSDCAVGITDLLLLLIHWT